MTMTMRIASLLPTFFLLGAGTTTVGAAEIGKPHSTVITLNDRNFDDHINDPANGLWFLKFYAPWCGHCKKLTPVLDAVAPFLAGKMSIGKVDCTTEKKVCKRFNVKGYPTLMYHRDGDFQDYPLGRDKDSIITFGEKMSSRAVKIVSTHEQANQELLDKIPVAFIVLDPVIPSKFGDDDNDDEEGEQEGETVESSIDASGATDEEKELEKLIQSTERTRAFGQVARKLQAQGSFGMLSENIPAEDIAKFFDGDGTAAAMATYEGFIARIEDGVPLKLYKGELTTAGVEEFVKEQNLATVIELGGHNFRFASRRGKQMAIVAYDPDEEVKGDKIKRELKQYAISGAHREDYVFATMDGKKWDKFISQFSITKENLPELFVIDVPGRVFWQDASVFDISEFIQGVKSGDIASREQEKVKSSPMDEFLQMFVDYMPWSMGLMFLLFILVFYCVLRFDGDGPLLPMPPPPASTAASSKPEAKKEKEDDSGDKVEKKKDQ